MLAERTGNANFMRRQLKHLNIVSDSRGFTLIEVVIVVAIIAIVVAISMPNMKIWQVHSRVNSDARTMLGVLQQARIEAVKRNEFCTVRFNQAVGSTTYDYVVFFDENANRVLDAGEKTFMLDNFNYATHAASFTGGVGAAIFNSRGLPSMSAVSSSMIIGNVLLSNPVDNYKKKIVVSSSGRIKIE